MLKTKETGEKCRNNTRIMQKGRLSIAITAAFISTALFLTACNNIPFLKKDDMADSEKLINENQDIFGWIIIPDTNIDYPIAQNLDGDNDYYRTHDITGKKVSEKGGIYIESYNMIDMCDFNTVIHGSTNNDGDMFSQLWNYADPTFFEEHPEFTIVLHDNVLTYAVWTAYVRDNTNVFMEYDFTDRDECQRYIDDMKQYWTTNTNIRKDWERGIDADNFLVSLSTVDANNPDKQWVVVGVLIDDKNGTIDR